MQQALTVNHQEARVNKAFSKQSIGYDADDQQNVVLQDMRSQVYAHVQRFIKPSSHVLEINAGTGIDALNLVGRGHRVMATDLSEGMIARIEEKIIQHRLQGKLTCKQLSYERLEVLKPEKFDFIFSNFGGLNCIPDLTTVTRNLPELLTSGALITWVIMPRIYVWEILGIFFGNGVKAFRRLKKNGVTAQLEGESFTTYYHDLTVIKKAFGKDFKLLAVEGLAAISPPPHRRDIPVKFPKFYRWLRHIDRIVRNHYPFNRAADHIIVTFKYNP